MKTISVSTPKEVATCIKHDLVQVRHLKLIDVAETLGISHSNLSNILCGRSRYRPKTANMLHQAFGYNLDYLTKGYGDLYGEASVLPTDNANETNDDRKPEKERREDYFGQAFDQNDQSLTKRERLLNNYAIFLQDIFHTLSKYYNEQFKTDPGLPMGPDSIALNVPLYAKGKGETDKEIDICRLISIYSKVLNELPHPEDIYNMVGIE